MEILYRTVGVNVKCDTWTAEEISHGNALVHAVRVHHHGGPEQLLLEEQPRPEPQANTVLVRVRAAGVNPLDWKIRQGMMQAPMPVTFPYTPGIEVAGIVEDVAPSETTFAQGQAVFGQCAGGHDPVLQAVFGRVPVEIVEMDAREPTM